MTKRDVFLWTAVVAVLVAGLLVFWYQGLDLEESRERSVPSAARDDVLLDDRVEDKRVLPLDPDLVDSRPVKGPSGEDWQINLSAAVTALDILPVETDTEKDLLTLHPSYAEACNAVQDKSARILPSVNMVDGKAKQFDDGLYAALDEAHYRGLGPRLRSHVDLVQRLYERAGRDSPAAPFLAAGLELAGVHVEVADPAKKASWLKRFRSNQSWSRPVGFYTWNDTLAAGFRFLRFFQFEFDEDNLEVPLAIARVLSENPDLLASYQRTASFYARLTNPLACLSVDDLAGMASPDRAEFIRRCQAKGVRREAVALFAPSTSKETILFDKLFPEGLPQNANLMSELIRAIRSGTVDLKPAPNSGWYDYQVYALETLLLPEKGEERDKLLLTRVYKKRMLEAFQALITKRREMHVRQSDSTPACALALEEPPKSISPRLRVEPCPSYYLRTARAYAFLKNFLDTTVGEKTLSTLHGLKPGGERPLDLGSELEFMRDLFYGLYLVSAEDIGLKTELLAGEPVDRDHCCLLASTWLAKAFADADVAADTRVSVPVLADSDRGVTRVWATLGVRMTHLQAQYARPPHIRPRAGGEWKLAESCGPSNYLIPVDEFAEVELDGSSVLTRDELRAVCDREKTREAIVEALQRASARRRALHTAGFVALAMALALLALGVRKKWKQGPSRGTGGNT